MGEQSQHTEIKISVRNLVEFILRSGDIDNRGGGSDKDAMQMGNRIHRKIQKRMGSDYQAEVPLRISREFDTFKITVEGRADGIITEKDEIVVIDEIKGMFQDPDLFEEPVEVHLAQGKCYAYIYAREHMLDEIAVQMTYVNMETEYIRRFKQIYSFEELEDWFTGLLTEYKKWAEFQHEWKQKRNSSIKQTEFPFSYREGQRELVASVYRTILRKKRLFIQASTGVGKTLAALFPAIRAVGEGLGDKIFYLTAKTITRTVAQDSFRLLKQQGLQYKVTTITAKDKMCFCDETECHPDYCPYAKGHYDRVNEAVFEMINEESEFTRETIERYARAYQICPYEMCLDATLWSDAIICDYNYVFDPVVHLKRFFSEGVKGDYLFLIDEAHNLVERSREMYSAVLYKEWFLDIKRMVKHISKKLTSCLDKCNKEMLEMKRDCDDYEILDNVSGLAMHVMRLFSELELFLEDCKDDELRKPLLDFYFELRNFLYVFERLDDNYVIYTEHESSGDFRIKLFCVEPADSLREYLDKGNSTVFFSATLLPIGYYKGLLGDEEEDYAVYAESTFPEQNRMVMLGMDVSSKYTRRNQSEYQKMAAYIDAMVAARKGNYIVFFPSYRLMEDVYECYMECDSADSAVCLVQTSGMNEAGREEFLEAFSEEREESLLGFCVMGGIFSEGIDLTHDRLIGVAIVGTGLPQVCNEREILKGYYEHNGRNGFEYAYLFAGMNKVLQAAGRVIRTSDDKGIILLLDERFNMDQYKKLFPREWKQFYLCNRNTISDHLSSFWGRK